MNKLLVCVLLLSALAWGGSSAAASAPYPPTILIFTCDCGPVTVGELEAGTLTATLTWRVAGFGDAYHLDLAVYRLDHWESLLEAGAMLPPVGSRVVQLEHPLNFGPLTYRLTVLDQAGQVVDERTLPIPYAESDPPLTPTIQSFEAVTLGVAPADLAAGTARVAVAWDVADRLPLTNLVFEQVLPAGDTRSVELPRDAMWVASTGQGLVAPVYEADLTAIDLRLRVIDVLDGHTYAEASLSVPVQANAATPVPAEAMPAMPTFTPVVVPTSTSTPPWVAPGGTADRACIENPYYGQAIIAMEWLEANGEVQPSAEQYGHAYLDALYAQLYADGQVGAVPPACTVTARSDLTVYASPDPASASIATLAAGDALSVYGRNAESTWFQVASPVGWGWVRRDEVDLQSGAELDRMPVLG